MRKSIIPPLTFLSLVLAFWNQGPVYSQELEFEKSFKDILLSPSAPGTVHVLDGTLINYRVIDSNPDSYTVELTVFQGEWPEPGRIQTYESRIFLTGPRLAEKFPERRPRIQNPPFIAPNSKVLFYGTYLRTERNQDGQPVLVFQGRGVRKLQ